MKLIFKFLKRHWIFAIIAPLFMFLEVMMDLRLPMIMASIVDDGISNNDLNLILTLGLKMIGVTLLAVVGGLGCGISSSYAASGMGADLRSNLFKKIQSLSYKNLDEIEIGNLITRMTSDVTQVENSVRMMLRVMIRAPLQVVGSFIMAVIISPSLSLTFLVLVPLLVISLVLITRKAFPLYRILQGKVSQVNIKLQENLSGQRLVKAFVRENFEEDKFAVVNDDLSDANIAANTQVAILQPMMMLIMNGGIVAVLWVGSQYIDSQVLRVGQLIAFLNYLRQLLASLMMIGQLTMMFSRAMASCRRIEEVFESTPYIENKPQSKASPDQGELAFNNVSFSYGEDKDVLKNISFTLKPEETLAIIGATGSGKSSLINLVPRFYDIQKGDITLDGMNILNMDVEQLRKTVAITPQHSTLFEGTVRSNILFHYPSSEHNSEKLTSLMEESAKAANIHDFLMSLPDRYETHINQRGVNFSGGQKQRITIARTLAKKGKVLIFDDSMSAVDMKTEKLIQQALYDLKVSKIIITQRVSAAINADQILLLEDGEQLALGTHSQLMSNSSVYQDIVSSQSHNIDEMRSTEQ